MSVLRSGVLAAAMVAASACVTSGGASPPSLDTEEGVSAPRYQPMLVVPLPELDAQRAPAGRPMEALQARRTPLGDVLLALFRDSDINLVIDPAVQAVECSFDIKSSTVEEAFEALLQSLDLAYDWDGSFLRIRDRIQETITVDLIDASNGSNTGSGSSGGGSGGSSNGSSSSGASSASFWSEIEGSLPTLLGEGGTFVINRTASAIHVDARPSGVRRVRDVVDATLGRANRQVSIEARVLEVRLNSQYSMGINWSMLPGMLNTSRAGLAGGGAVISQTAASGGTAFSFGLFDSGDWSVFVDALQLQGQVRVLSSPRVSTLNNQPATINVTDQVPYVVREVFTTQGIAQTQYSIEFAKTGVVLGVRPLIGEDGMLSVQITPAVLEQVGTAVTPDGLVTVPVISERTTTTTVRVADGQAIALGGLRSTRKSESRQGIPFLMDLPWLGAVFSNQVQERDEVELMIMIVPRVLDDTWIGEEVQRGAHRLVKLRRGFQWNPLRMEGFRPEDWSGGSLQGDSQAAASPGIRLPAPAPRALGPDNGMTVTRRGLADHLIRRADGELARGDMNAAQATLARALELEPTRRDALVTAGVLCERRGDRRRAGELLDAALELDPADVVALTARGTLEMDAGSPFAAYRYFERAHELGNTMLTAANVGAALIQLGRIDAARELLRASAGPAAPPELHANLAFAELSTGHPEHARESLNRAYAAGADARNPRTVALERLVADAEQGMHQKALEQAAEHRP